MFKRLQKSSIPFIAFLQATTEILYISLVAVIFWGGDQWFGKMNNFAGPILVLTLLSVSVLISALITLCYPFILFWEHKKPKKAIKLITYTTLWLIFYFLLLLTSLFITNN